MMERIVIENGRVYDPLSRSWKERSICLADGRIVENEAGRKAGIRVNAAGCLVTPGLIDFHLHGFQGASDLALDPDTFCLPCGVTSCVDAGTAGTAGFEALFQNVICKSRTRMSVLLHLAPEGMVSTIHPENQDPSGWDTGRICYLREKYPDVIAGLKIRMSAGILKAHSLGAEVLDAAVSFAEKLGLPLVVHVNDPGMGCEDIVGKLRPGDVYCHMYAGRKETILDSDGRVRCLIKKARERGVIFDACNGRGNFLFSVAKPCMNQGFWPDIISTDGSSLVQYRQPVISLPRLLSKYLALGMPLEAVLDAATIAPARWLGREDLASMQAGTPADITIWKLKEKHLSYTDVAGDICTGSQVLVPQMTIRNGIIEYCRSDFQ